MHGRDILGEKLTYGERTTQNVELKRGRTS